LLAGGSLAVGLATDVNSNFHGRWRKSRTDLLKPQTGSGLYKLYYIRKPSAEINANP